jgi:hypothetical protein
VYVYLLASLPGFTLDDPPPMGVADLVDRCRGLVPGEVLAALTAPEAAAEGTGPVAALARRWRDGERQLRNASGRRRAARWGVSPAESQRPHEGFRVDIEDEVARSFETPSPLVQARVLDALRWRLLDDLAREDAFGLAALFAYARRLALAEAWARRTPDAGRAALARALERIEVDHV